MTSKEKLKRTYQRITERYHCDNFINSSEASECHIIKDIKGSQEYAKLIKLSKLERNACCVLHAIKPYIDEIFDEYSDTIFDQILKYGYDFYNDISYDYEKLVIQSKEYRVTILFEFMHITFVEETSIPIADRSGKVSNQYVIVRNKRFRIGTRNFPFEILFTYDNIFDLLNQYMMCGGYVLSRHWNALCTAMTKKSSLILHHNAVNKKCEISKEIDTDMRIHFRFNKDEKIYKSEIAINVVLDVTFSIK